MRNRNEVYTLSVALCNVKNKTTRKNVLLPVSFLTLVEPKVEKDHQKVIGDLTPEFVESCLQSFIKNNSSFLELVHCVKEDGFLVNCRSIYQAGNGIRSEIDYSLINSALGLMIIEVVGRTRYYVLSTDIRWNLGACDYTFFASSFYHKLFAEQKVSDGRPTYALEGYLRMIWEDPMVDNLFRARPVLRKKLLPEILERPREEMGKLEVENGYRIDQMSPCLLDISMVDRDPLINLPNQSENAQIAKAIHITMGYGRGESDTGMDRLIGNEYTSIEDLNLRMGSQGGWILLDTFHTMCRPALSELPLLFVTPDTIKKPEYSSCVNVYRSGEIHATIEQRHVIRDVRSILDVERSVEMDNVYAMFHRLGGKDDL